MRIAPFALGLALFAVAPAPARAASIKVQPGVGTLQTAIDAAAEGDTILLGPGTYTGAVSVSGKNNLRIRGRGNVVIDANSTRTGLNILNVNGLRVEGVKIINATNDGIHMDACANVILSRCIVDNSSGKGSDSGIEVVGTLDGLTIDRCTFTLWGYGIYVNTNTVDPKTKITRCKIQGTTDSDSIDVYNSNVLVSRNVIVGNTVSAPGGYGVYLGPASAGCTVSQNRVSAVSDPGVTVQGSAHKIDRNSIRDVSGTGISVVRGTGHVLTRNTVTNSGGAAFAVAVAGNTFTKNKASGTTSVDLSSDVDESTNTYTGNKFRTTSFPAN